MKAGHQRLLAALIVGIAVAVGWFAYGPALSGTFLLDDESNLSALGQVEDTLSALIFVFSGSAGPLGRPLSLATFVPQAGAWGITAEPFLKVNILIHLINTCILAWVLHRLSIVRRVSEERALFIAVAAASIWLFMPLLASASLMVIQRMTTLSALFVLLGLAGYLYARQIVEANPRKALVGMSVSLIAGTTIAALAKENGALLPVFVLIIEITVLRSPVSVRQFHWRAWTSTFLLLPTVLILAYIASRAPYSPELILKRDFTAWERLLTQSRILWEYLFNAFVPQMGKFGPFHDDYPIARSITDPVTFLAFAGWVAAFLGALICRRRYPLLAFAVLWYLGGHLLESTILPLDLYYEHRNYLPIVGPVYALCDLLAQALETRKKLAYAGTAIYVLVNALVLFSLATLWGNPSQAFSYWKERFPDSMYAVTAALSNELEADGPRHTVETLKQLVAAKPEAGYLKIQELKLSCNIDSQRDHSEKIVELDRMLKNVDFSYTAIAMLSGLTENYDCNGVSRDTIRKLGNTLLQNPRYKGDALYNSLHYRLMALMSHQEGKFDEAVQHLKKAVEFSPSPDLNTMIVVTYTGSGNFDAARAYIDEVHANAPYHPMKRYVWLKNLDSLRDEVDKLEQRRTPESP
jgi:tetratricopeptide (TPR) repeat protein